MTSLARRFVGFTTAAVGKSEEQRKAGVDDRPAWRPKVSSHRSRKRLFQRYLLQQMSGHVVLSWSPEVAAQLAGECGEGHARGDWRIPGPGRGHRYKSR